MTVGIGIFSLPYYISVFGVLSGTIVLILAALLNYYSFKLIFEVASKIKKKSYIACVWKTLGSPFY